MIANVKSLISESRDNWKCDGITKRAINELDCQSQKLNEIEQNFNNLALPSMQIKISTLPRNKLDLDCQLLFNTNALTKKFCPSNPGKIISIKCLCSQQGEYENEKINVDTEVEECNQNFYSTKDIQTDANNELIPTKYNDFADNTADDKEPEDEYFSLQEDLNELSNLTNIEHYLSKQYIAKSTILTQYEVDRIASDGEHLLYFSDTSKSLCYVRSMLSDTRNNGATRTVEITCRWPHYPILDIVYSPASSQFVCATKTGVYTCTIDSDHDESTIDIQLQVSQSWSYIRLSSDENFLWIWTDTPNFSQLQVYSPKTFDCIKTFNLQEYPRFSDNSTSFCVHAELIATVFQYKQTTNSMAFNKSFHITLCDSLDLHEICTINLGECDFDHEIRANNNGVFFITDGKRKLWIVDRFGKKEYVKLFRTGRALTIHSTNQLLIANGTRQLQRVDLVHDESRIS